MAEVHPSPVLPTTPPPAPRSCHERPRGYAPPRVARPHGQSTFTATARSNAYVQRKTIQKKPRRFPHLTIAEEQWIENEEYGLLCALQHIKEMEDEDKRERHAHLQKAIRQIARQIRENA